MTIRATTIRLFVSSTFADFRREREILQREVFPAIARICSARGVNFQPVDLRWGIGPDAAFAQQTLRICLDEVTRCTQSSLRPYFLVLIGDRYGWQPLPHAIDRLEATRLLRWIKAHEGRDDACPPGITRDLAQAYRLDRNGVPPQRMLQPRSVFPRQRWSAVEARLRRALRRAAAALRLPMAKREKYFLSATAHEIERGVLRAPKDVPDVRQHVLCFVRRRLDFSADGQAGQFLRRGALQAGRRVDADPDDAEARQLLERLRSRLERALGYNVLVYHSFAAPASTVARFEAAFRDDARRLLTALVLREVRRLGAFGADEAEWLHHAEFGAERARQVTGRVAEIDRLDIFLDRRDARSMLVRGAGGMCKTALVAKAAQMGRDRGLVVLQRYVGTSAAASEGRSLLSSLVRELQGATGLMPARSNDVGALGAELRRQLQEAARRAPEGVLLAIDALDQLEPADPARRLEWLPLPVPDRVALLISAVDGDLQRRLADRLPKAASIVARAMARRAGREALRALLRETDRRLQPVQEAAVLRGFRSEGSPLYIRLAAEVVRYWPALAGEVPIVEPLPPTTDRMIERLFDMLADPRRHGPHLVAAVFGLLAASRHGLAEHELIALLSARTDLMRWVRRTSPEARHVQTLPFIFWARLRDDLAPFFAERAAEQTPVLSLFHRLFEEAARRRFGGEPAMQRALRQSIAAHFGAQGTWQGEGRRVRPNLRKLSELPYQLSQLEAGRELAALLADAEYCRAKIAAGLEADLYSEFLRADELCRGESRPATRRPLLDALVRVIEGAILQPRAFERFDLEQLHAAMAHRRMSSFYADFLRRCNARLRRPGWRAGARLQRLRVGIDLRLANLARRDNELADAERQLGRLLPLARRWCDPAEVSRIEYDLGYIEFLRGRLQAAVQAFERSARTALAAGRPVGHGISHCLAANVRWIDSIARFSAQEGATRFLSTLSETETVFRTHASSDAAALRWLYNVAAHRFRIGFRLGDRQLARRAVDALEADVWLSAQPDRPTELAAVRARRLMIDGAFADGARELEQIARGWLRQSPRREALAESFFGVGMAHARAGAAALAPILFR